MTPLLNSSGSADALAHQAVRRSVAARRSQDRRRPIGVVLLACIALVAIARLRMASEPLWVILCESFVPALLLAAAYRWLNLSRVEHLSTYSNAPSASHSFHLSRFETQRNGWLAITTVAVALSPWLMQVILRLVGAGTGWEIVGMSSIGWATLSAALLARQPRTQSSSTICSGFLTLAATCSSDSSSAVIFAMLWGVCCLWWLVSLHWQRFERCQASTSVESLWYRPVTVLGGCAVFALAAWLTAGRFPTPQRLGLEIMPTSGGTTSHDAFARSGVGDGDAVVAAREHAASFGAVDSDLFLDSDEPSLFDLYSETFGEPIRKKSVERTVALSSVSELEQPQKASESEGSGATFTTQRGTPKPRTVACDSLSDAVLFWIGRADTHLAMERFTEFDGVQWSNPTGADLDRKPGDGIAIQKIGDRVWFSMNSMWDESTLTPYVGARAEAIKYAGLRSPKIPTPSGIQAWHLQQIEDPTLFLLSPRHELAMAGRERVPDYTVLRFVNREMDLQRIEQLLQKQTVRPLLSDTANASPTAGVLAARELATQALAASAVTNDPASPSETDWQKIQTILTCLHSQFSFDRAADYSEVEDPLAEFISQRRGSDAMFATAAAVMLQSLGYRSRLTTGFIASRENRVGIGQEFAIFPTDTHAWIEIDIGAGNWIPLEPTPGFPIPFYHVSWGHWLQHNWMRLATGLIAFLASSWLLWRARAMLFDGLMYCSSCLLWLASDAQRSRALVWLIDWRCRLIGLRRPKHMPPRLWLLRMGITDQTNCSPSLNSFFSEADRLCFGSSTTMSPDGRRACIELWRSLTCRQLSRMSKQR